MGMARRTLTLSSPDNAGGEHTVEVLDGPERRATVNGTTYAAVIDRDGSLRITGDTTTRAWAVAAGEVRWVFVDGRVFELAEARGRTRARGGHHGSLTAPMPATVRRVLVREGDAVKRGDTLLILEAMKMELPVRADATGIVGALLCREGDLVQPGVPLIEISA
jgi:acetyl-CoA/propionyl-CoA carboxylase, biotin carboxylase, biotin carboxyl carrier protein